MKLLFKQRMWSWFDSYDIYDENGNTVYTVQGVFHFPGHNLIIYDNRGYEVGQIIQQFSFLRPKFTLVENGREIGEIVKEITFLRPSFTLSFNNWIVEGDFWQWDYQVYDDNQLIMTASKELLNWTDTYSMDIVNPKDALHCLMIVLAIDAIKCSDNNN